MCIMHHVTGCKQTSNKHTLNSLITLEMHKTHVYVLRITDHH